MELGLEVFIFVLTPLLIILGALGLYDSKFWKK